MARVLLIDDDESNRLTLAGVLELEGFDVETIASTAEARVRCECLPEPDLVLLDQHLGDGVGTDLVPVLRTKFRSASVVLMSGIAGSADRVPATVDGRFTKGEPVDDLLATIAALLFRGPPTQR